MNRDLPIYEVMPQIVKTAATSSSLVIEAPPGAGKTTAVPLEMIDQSWLKGRKIVMLEPRRLAARNAAWWMARQLGEKTGERVGYSVHLDRKVSDQTVIEVVTEGVFLNRLVRDPELSDTAMVIFDEFHERSLNADLALTLLRETREILRDDLKIMIMSATLDAAPVAAFLDDAPVITSQGKCYPVEIRYREDSGGDLMAHTVRVIKEAVAKENGSLLVFLPGVGEIKKVLSSLSNSLPEETGVFPLYGNLPGEDQERAIEPAERGKRKIVLATSIAESSLTIKGIRVVIDSGLVRSPRFNPRTGMDSLETGLLSMASADQRSGRAGRLEAGVCYRLWNEFTRLEPHAAPGITVEDLSGLTLTLTRWGYSDFKQLDWLTAPDESIFKNSRRLLEELGAIDASGLTEKGKRISNLPFHPRLGAMVLAGEDLGTRKKACDLAALLSERDCLRFPGDYYQCDIECRLEALDGKKPVGGSIDRAMVSRIREYSRSLGSAKSGCDTNRDFQAGFLLISAYPDRIGKKRDDGTYSLSNGSQASVERGDSLAQCEYLVIPALGGTGPLPRVFLAASIEEEELQEALKSSIKEEDKLIFDREKNRFSAFREQKLGHLVLKKQKINHIDKDRFGEALLLHLEREGISALNWNKETNLFRNRIMFLRREGFDSYPDLSEEALKHDLSWLTSYLSGMTLKSRLEEIPLLDALKGMVDWSLLGRMDDLAPTHLTVPSGSRIPIDYSEREPVLKVRLQELFGLDQTPLLCGGRHKLTIHLLSPASRPIQITRDLKSFWENTYNEVKKDLKGRYPKHYWPDNPYEAEPTNRAKRRMK